MIVLIKHTRAYCEDRAVMEASRYILKIFYCYAREDKAFREELETHLFGLRRQQLITTWSDREIDPGMEWGKEIDTHLNASHLILLLVSPNFLASDYCYGIEMKRALERHEAGDVRVVPIIIRPVYWQDAPFSKLQVLPTSAKPISLWSNRDNAWLDVVKGIREVIKKLQISLMKKENQLKRDLVEEGMKLLEQERYEEALTKFDKTIALDKEYEWAIAQRGEGYRLMKRYEEALADFDRAIELNNEESWNFTHRGTTYREIERYEEALADFDRAIEPDDKNAWAIAGRGDTYRLMKRYEEALADFDRAIELDDENAWAIASRGDTYREMERYEEALADFDKAITLESKEAWIIASRGEVYLLTKRYEEALADFDRAIALDKMDEWWWYNRALTNLLTFNMYNFFLDIKSALDIALNRIQQNTGNYAIAFNAALIQLVSGQFQGAEARYTDLITNCPAIYSLQDAARDLANFLEIQPKHELARKIHDGLQKRIDELK